MTFCRSIYVKKVMKLLAFIFEQPSYTKAIFWKDCISSHAKKMHQTFPSICLICLHCVKFLIYSSNAVVRDGRPMRELSKHIQ